MLSNSVVIAAATQDAATEGSKHLATAMGGQLMGSLLARDHRANFLRKHAGKVERHAAFVAQPFGRCTFDKKKVDGALAEHQLKAAFIGTTSPPALNLFDKVPSQGVRDVMTVRFSVWPGQDAELQNQGGAVTFISDRIQWVMQQHMRFADDVDLWCVVRGVGSEHPHDYYVSLLLATRFGEILWPEVIGALWTSAEAHPQLMHYQGLHREQHMASLLLP